MEHSGKLVDHNKLVNQIFLPKPTLFTVVKCESIGGLEDVYTVPLEQWKLHTSECHKWWGNVFQLAKLHRIRVEKHLVEEEYTAGFRFYEPEISYITNSGINLENDCTGIKNPTLGKEIAILEMIVMFKVLEQIIAEKRLPSPELNNHLITILGDTYRIMEGQCFGMNPIVDFPIGTYLVEYGRLKGLSPWELAKVGLLSEYAAHEFTMLEEMRMSAELEDMMIQTGQIEILEDTPSVDISSTAWIVDPEDYVDQEPDPDDYL